MTHSPNNERPDVVSQEQADAARKLWRHDERRIMDYFWNTRNGDHRKHVPTSVIYWLEGERGNLDRDRIDFELSDLVNNTHYLLGNEDYLAAKTVGDSEGYELTNAGVAYLTKMHPTVFQYWEKALQLTPRTLSLLAAVVGFIASAFGIIQFVAWVRKLMP